MSSPLAGLLVLDFSHALAGPYCTMLMARYGATVIKIEDTATGDMGRTWGPPFLGDEASYFLGLNSGKRGVAIDLKDPAGVGLCKRLIERADVLIENFRPGTMDRLGLGYAAAREINPRLIYCSISGYGQTGPRRDDSAMDLILQASSGLISVTGTADGETVRCGHSVADISAGMFALIGTMFALRTRESSGAGQYVDVSMLDGMISAMASNYANFFGSGTVPRPWGTGFGTIVPYACYRAADREIALAVASEKLWRAFCQGIGQPDWIDHERFRTNALRIAHRAELEPLIETVLGTRKAADWVAIFGKYGVPATLVNTLDDVANDPHSAAREMFPIVDHPTAGPIKVTGAPLKLSGSETTPLTAAPFLGQHTIEVLADLLDLGPEELNLLVRNETIRQHATP
ncbi:MAG: CaiB/BaiF CoA transferase family protein [Gemmatimonadales bacterium]